jgi:hypothetical protein
MGCAVAGSQVMESPCPKRTGDAMRVANTLGTLLYDHAKDLSQCT